MNREPLCGLARYTYRGATFVSVGLSLALGCSSPAPSSPDAASSADAASSPDAGPVADAAPAVQSSFLVSWNLTAAPNDVDPPSAVGCATAGVEVIRTLSTPVGGVQFIDLFDCLDGAHETAPLPIGEYDVSVQALDPADNVVAQSFATRVTLFEGPAQSVDFEFPTNIGYLGLSWTLAGTCQAGDGVSVLTTPVNSGGSFFDEIFDCTDGSAVTTQNIPVGDLTVSTSLIDDQDNILSQSAPRSVTIEYGNHLVDLGTFQF